MRRLLLAAGAAVLVLSFGASAQDVRPPAGASVGGMSSGDISLPETSTMTGSPEIRTTAMEKKRFTGKSVDKQTVEALKQMAIAAGQSSRSEPGETKAGPTAAERGTLQKSRQSFFGRMRERGIEVPSGG